MAYLDKRNETYGTDLKIAPDLACRAEIMANSDKGTDVTVQELINLVCNLLDGEDDHDIVNMVGEEDAERVISIRRQLLPLWTLADGSKVVVTK